MISAIAHRTQSNAISITGHFFHVQHDVRHVYEVEQSQPEYGAHQNRYVLATKHAIPSIFSGGVNSNVERSLKYTNVEIVRISTQHFADVKVRTFLFECRCLPCNVYRWIKYSECFNELLHDTKLLIYYIVIVYYRFVN